MALPLASVHLITKFLYLDKILSNDNDDHFKILNHKVTSDNFSGNFVNTQF